MTRRKLAAELLAQPAFAESEGILSLITKEELRRRLDLPSTRMVDELKRRRVIPFIKLGHRTVRFDWHRVQAAIARFEIQEVGRK